jgi:hypothetical protein
MGVSENGIYPHDEHIQMEKDKPIDSCPDTPICIL